MTLKKFLTKKSLSARIGLATGIVLLSATASAELQVAALMEGVASKSLLAGNLERADKILPNRATRRMDYADTNNLCVLQILQQDEVAAVGTCQMAVRKLKSAYIERRAMSSLVPEVYNNLAVAQLLSGDRIEAQKSLAVALSATDSGSDEPNNAEINQVVFQRTFSLAEL